MRIEPMGDSGFLLRDLPWDAYLVADALRAFELPGVVDVTASYETVGIYAAAPGALDQASLEQVVQAILRSATPSEPNTPILQHSKTHLIPVCYSLGEDLAEVAASLGLTPDELVRQHTSAEYRCFAVGFCPGFAYLGWLPDAISGVPRRGQPRVRVEPGSVGITGRQTGVYPLVRPGGWALIGRTPLVLVDEADDYFPIKAGDLVRFRAIDVAEFERLMEVRL